MLKQQNNMPVDSKSSAHTFLSSHEKERRELAFHDISQRIKESGVHEAKAHPDRARQFMPFAALKGYHELARKQERVPEPRQAMTEERSLLLSQTLSNLKRGDIVSVTHYENSAYVTTQGKISELNEAFHSLRIVKKKISFNDILAIEAIE